MASSTNRQGNRQASAAQDLVLHDVLGQGGMAVVYRGTQNTPAGTRTVAIKRIADRSSQEATARLVEEGRLVFRLNHANICQVLDLAVTEDGTYLVMEFVDGTDLRHLIKHASDAGEPLETEFAVYAARETARALDYAHRRTDDHGRALMLVHGDVTPQNILISREGEVKLSDFGIARSLGNNAPGNDLATAGTPYFMAPEVTESGADHRADVFGLGVTLYLALGGTPFKSGIDPRDLAQRRPMLGDELIHAIERATGPVSERYKTAGELESTLAAYLARRSPHFTPSMLGQAVRRMVPAKPSARLAGSRSLQTHSSFTSHEIAFTIVDRVDAAHAPDAAIAESVAELRLGTLPATPRRKTGRAVIAILLAFVAASLAFFARRTMSATSVVVAPPIVAAPLSAPAIEARPLVPQPPPAPRPVVATAQRAPAPRPPGYLSVNASPWGVLYVDGRKMAPHTPVYRMSIAPGLHSIQVRSPDGARRSPAKPVAVESRQAQVVSFEW